MGGPCQRRDRSLVFIVKFFSDGGDLAELELGEAEAAPSFGGSDERAEHKLEHRLLAAVGNDLEPSPFLHEQPFEQVRRPCKTAMRDRQWQMRNAGYEIVFERGERGRQSVGVIGADTGRQLTHNRP